MSCVLIMYYLCKNKNMLPTNFSLCKIFLAAVLLGEVVMGTLTTTTRVKFN